MVKRILALLIAMALLPSLGITAGAEDNDVLKPVVLFESDFENGGETKAGRMSMTNTSVGEYEKGNTLKANSAGGVAQFYVYAEKEPENCEATLVSFDMWFEKNTTRGYMDIFQPAEDGKAPSMDMNKLSRSMYIVQDGRLSYFESFMPPCGTRVVNSLMYTPGRWYHYDMWIDYTNKCVYYFIDGMEQVCLPITDEFKGFGGFRYTVESMNGGALYQFDNMKVVSFPKRGAKVPYEGIGIPDNFEDPVTIEYKTKENNLGFIFLNKDVELNATFKNVLDEEEKVDVKTVITDDENQVVAEFSEQLTIKAQSEEKRAYKQSVEKYGFYYIETVLAESDTGNLISKEKFQFSVLNAPPEGLRNGKFAFNDHTAAGHGLEEYERKIKLFADLGAGGIRVEVDRNSSKWYTDRTTYELSDTQLKVLQEEIKNNYELCVLLTWGKVPPVTDAEYKEWERYCTTVIETVNKYKKPGQKIFYEVWNEYNGAGFNYIGATSHDYYNLLKVTYPLVKKLDPTAEVWGLVTSPTLQSNGDMDAIDWIRQVFEYGGGEYMDAANVHTYTHAAPEDFHTKRGKMISDTRALLDEFGYKDMKIVTSEMGWTTPGVVDEVGQAAYIVRWAAMIYDQLGEVYWYVNQDKQTTSAHENGFGFIRTWSKSATGDYPVYSAKPALLSYAAFNTLMTDAKFEKIIEKTDGANHIYKFKTAEGKDVLIIWNNSGAEETLALKLNTEKVTMYDMYGNAKELNGLNGNEFTFDISGNPVYIMGSFSECEKVEPKFTKLTAKVDTTESDIAYLQFKNQSGKNVKLELDLPANITETGRKDGEISFATGGNSVDGEKIHVRVVDEITGSCYFAYEVPVIYKDIVTYELKPSYFRNGRWQCVAEIKNNKYSGSVSGRAIVKEPKELADQSERLVFKDLKPRDVKLLRINLPQELAGAHLDLTLDIELDSGEKFKDVKNSVYMTAMSRMKKAPVIDGKLDVGEWNKQMPMVINNASQVKLSPDWSGPEDLSAKVYCAYDKDNFYLAAEVVDDIMCDVEALGRAWAVDSIQFSFAKENVASSAITEYGIAQVNGKAKVDRYSFIGVNEGIMMEKDVNTYDDVQLEVKREGNKTIYESKVPWKQIYADAIDDVTALDKVYFSLLVNENDGAGRHGWLEYCAGIGEGKNAALFIPVELSKN